MEETTKISKFRVGTPENIIKEELTQCILEMENKGFKYDRQNFKVLEFDKSKEQIYHLPFFKSDEETSTQKPTP